MPSLAHKTSFEIVKKTKYSFSEMKNIFSSQKFLFFIVIFLSYDAFAEQKKLPDIRVAHDHVTLLESADAKSKVIDDILMGTPVTWTGKKTKGFVEIKAGTKTGWVSTKDLKLIRKKFDSIENDENFNPPSNWAAFQFRYVIGNGDDAGKGKGYEVAWVPRYPMEENFWLLGSLGATLFSGEVVSMYAMTHLEAFIEYRIKRFAVDMGGGFQALIGPGGGVGPALGGYLNYRLPGPFYRITILGGYEAAKFPGMSKPTSEFKVGIGIQL